MTDAKLPRLAHLHRMTDAGGLIRSAQGDVPDRSGGYDALQNAEALRLCASVSDTVEGTAWRELADRYYACLSRGRTDEGRLRHHADAEGRWSDPADDDLVQSRLARALSAVIGSELPVEMRLSASAWWNVLIDRGRRTRSPRGAADWIIAIAGLPQAHPGRDLSCLAALARWLVEDCHYPMRCPEWEWFEPIWQPAAACIPEALWHAHDVLGEPRFEKVADVATQFVIDQLFEDGLFLPVGDCGQWHRRADRPVFDQLPAEACSVVELLCTAQSVGGRMGYGSFAEFAHRWFTGNNVRGISMIDPTSGGCCDAIRVNGPDGNQGGGALVASLLAEAAMSNRPVIIEERTVHAAYVG